MVGAIRLNGVHGPLANCQVSLLLGTVLAGKSPACCSTGSAWWLFLQGHRRFTEGRAEPWGTSATPSWTHWRT